MERASKRPPHSILLERIGKLAIGLLDSGDAVVSWIRRQGKHSEIILSRVRTDGSIVNFGVIAEGSSDGLGYPKMQNNGSQVLVSWGGTNEAGGVNTTLITSQ